MTMSTASSIFGLATFCAATLLARADMKPVDFVDVGSPCALEGQRVFIANGDDMDVYHCDCKQWKFLYKRLPNEGIDD